MQIDGDEEEEDGDDGWSHPHPSTHPWMTHTQYYPIPSDNKTKSTTIFFQFLIKNF